MIFSKGLNHLATVDPILSLTLSNPVLSFARYRPKNFCVQYEPNLMSENDRLAVLESDELTHFLQNVAGR